MIQKLFIEGLRAKVVQVHLFNIYKALKIPNFFLVDIWDFESFINVKLSDIQKSVLLLFCSIASRQCTCKTAESYDY